MCNRCSFFTPQTAIDTLFQYYKLQYPTIAEHPTHHIHYDLHHQNCTISQKAWFTSEIITLFRVLSPQKSRESIQLTEYSLSLFNLSHFSEGCIPLIFSDPAAGDMHQNSQPVRKNGRTSAFASACPNTRSALFQSKWHPGVCCATHATSIASMRGMECSMSP